MGEVMAVLSEGAVTEQGYMLLEPGLQLCASSSWTECSCRMGHVASHALLLNLRVSGASEGVRPACVLMKA